MGLLCSARIFLASRHYKIDFNGRFDVKMNTSLCVYTTKKLLEGAT